MTCDQIQETLSTWANEKHSRRDEARMAEHLRKCEDCRRFASVVRRIDAAAPALHAATPAVRVWPRRVAPWFALAALVPAFLVLTAKGAPAYADLRRMEQAVRDAGDVHVLVRWRSGARQEGSLQKVEELWYSRGRMRKSAPREGGGERIVLESDHRLWFYRYDPATRNVQKVEEMAPQPVQFDMRSVAPRFMPAGARIEFRHVGPANWNGSSCELYEALAVEGMERIRFWLRSGTELPVHAEKDIFETGHWKTNGTLDLEYDHAWPDAMFRPESLVPENGVKALGY